MGTVEGLMCGVEYMTVQVKHFLLVLLHGAYTSEYSLDAAYEYVHGERLGLIVVTAQLERPHLVFSVAACGKHDEWYRRHSMAYVLD